ncbi:hypothetical protein LG634_05420 [Streptomyces bambusae]|uniref:hypothetical protein n=1 Tax=Streptomyces bambusae TaxID=1550616 RepID=UPI001CFE1E6E|nr:hypothetical protein [Streptomyces bambusae]MCB5164278.1 hypothetical protein [Streptomyces bambusae]
MTSTEVTVVLGDCAETDARAVLAALGEAFPSAEGPAGPAAGGGGATVWTSVFDVAAPGGHSPAGPVPLGRPVTVEAQGGYGAVDRLLAELAAVFAVEDQGTAAGDQEKDVHLRLRSRASQNA